MMCVPRLPVAGSNKARARACSLNPVVVVEDYRWLRTFVDGLFVMTFTLQMRFLTRTSWALIFHLAALMCYCDDCARLAQPSGVLGGALS